MLELSLIQDTVTQIADAITAVLEIDTEIVDNNLLIVSGTGRFRKKVGTYEEYGEWEHGGYYRQMIETGEEQVCLDTKNHPFYNPMEGELSEITCPIIFEGNVVGLIGLIAFTEEQHQVLCTITQVLCDYLRKMAELLASKLVESQSNIELAMLIDSAPQGIIATHTDGRIISCNKAGEELLGIRHDDLVDRNIKTLFPNERLFAETREKSEAHVEVQYKGDSLYLTYISIPGIGRLYFFQDNEYASELMRRTISDSQITFDDIIGASDALSVAKERAKQIAANDSSVLITGESGTGKELFARAIHAASERRNHPFVSINCGAIPEALFESEFFGYEKGAFTGANQNGKIGKLELANKGTVFLDEIGDLPLHLQVKLLRVLQDREITRVGGTASKKIDIRLIAATNRPLEEMVRRKEFRGDLYYRLSVIPLHLPPLRMRQSDLGIILTHALNKFNAIMNKNIRGFTSEAMKVLTEYSWPGNIREVENTVEYCVNIEKTDMIQLKNLPERVQAGIAEPDTGSLPGTQTAPGSSLTAGSGTLKEQLEQAERLIIRRTLEQTGSDRTGKTEAARILGIGESSLYRKIKDLNI